MAEVPMRHAAVYEYTFLVLDLGFEENAPWAIALRETHPGAWRKALATTSHCSPAAGQGPIQAREGPNMQGS